MKSLNNRQEFDNNIYNLKRIREFRRRDNDGGLNTNRDNLILYVLYNIVFRNVKDGISPRAEFVHDEPIIIFKIVYEMCLKNNENSKISRAWRVWLPNFIF